MYPAPLGEPFSHSVKVDLFALIGLKMSEVLTSKVAR